MKTQAINLISALVLLIAIPVAYVYKFGRRYYRRFCIKVLWKQFHIQTPVYHKWHDHRAKKLQLALDNEHSAYPSF